MTKEFLDSFIGLDEQEAEDIAELKCLTIFPVEEGVAIPLMVYVNTVILTMKDGLVIGAEPGDPSEEE